MKPQIDQYLERKAQQDIIVALREQGQDRASRPARRRARDAGQAAEPKKP